MRGLLWSFLIRFKNAKLLLETMDTCNPPPKCMYQEACFKFISVFGTQV